MRKMLAIVGAILLVGASVEAQEGDPLAELAALGNAVAETQPEGGGSIRAKKEADLTRTQRLAAGTNLEAKVEQISSKKFPLVALKVKVNKPAKEGKGKDVKANDTIVVVPKLKVAGKTVAMDDADTQVNAGAFYLQSGDKVAIRLGEKKGNYYEAEYIERK
jgi:hypothetical protein